LTLEQFVSIPSGKGRKGEQRCRVAGCERISVLRGRICPAQDQQRRTRHPDLTAEQFAALPNLTPFASFGPCRVRSCVRGALYQGMRLCPPHAVRWRQFRREHPGLGIPLEDWLAIADPINIDHCVILKGLREQVQLELLIGLQARTDAGYKTVLTAVRSLVTALRAHDTAGLAELDEATIKRGREDTQVLLRSLVKLVRRTVADSELERLNDVWDLAVFGLRGRIRFTGISQPWLRETTKRWVENDLPLHRGRQACNTAKTVVAAVEELSESLRLARDDRGEHPTELDRRDILALTNRLAFKERTGMITRYTRLSRIRQLRRFLTDIRPLGLTKDDGPSPRTAR
jgi:hypothetical protein